MDLPPRKTKEEKEKKNPQIPTDILHSFQGAHDLPRPHEPQIKILIQLVSKAYIL